MYHIEVAGLIVVGWLVAAFGVGLLAGAFCHAGKGGKHAK